MNHKDPSQMDTERRLLLALLLSMTVLLVTPYLYQKLFPPPLNPTPPPEQMEMSSQVQEAEVEPVQEWQEPLEMSLPSEWLEQATARTLRVENRDLILHWDTAGAVLRSVQLKGYLTAGGEPLELIVQDVGVEPGAWLELGVDDEDVQRALEGAVYEVEPPDGTTFEAPAVLTFRLKRGSLQVTKRVEVPPEGYLLRVAATVRLGGRSIPYQISLGPGLGRLGADIAGDFGNPLLAFYTQQSVERYSADDLEDSSKMLAVAVRWAALDTNYFSAALLLKPDRRGLRLSRVDGQGVDEDGEPQPQVALQLAAELEKDAQWEAFLGPKDHKALFSADPSLPAIIDYGWFAVLVKPLLFCLRFAHQYVDNWGWAIIVLTFLINLALFPIRYKQMASMQKMGEVQPQLKAVQDKYKKMKRDDPRRSQMNEEVMALYRQHGVNPLGGCLPLVVQMPFLFAFYRMLASSIELRGAPFIFWIKDLSRHDPYYVTPIVMGITMVAQQKMSPATGDPTQRRMMMMLPLVFTFFFLNLSSGLVLYFLFSNVFGMLLQSLLQRWKPGLAASKGAKTAAGKGAKGAAKKKGGRGARK